MKLIQLNIWQGKILIAVERFLKEQDADIVCLQEVFSSDGKGTFAWLDNLESLENLQKKLNYPHCYFEPTLTFDAAGGIFSCGNAILSKFPLTNRRAVFTHGALHHVADWHADYIPNSRNAQITDVNVDDQTSFTLVNHHGYWAPTRAGDEGTTLAMQKLVDEIKPIAGPLVVAGDFNIAAESPAMRLFDGWLEDLSATHNLTDTLTEFGKVNDVPCDHILINKDINVRSFEKSPVLVSDHSPLILEFDL